MTGEVSKEDFRELDGDVVQMGREIAGMKVEITQLKAAILLLVSKEEFLPVKVITYGLVAGALGAVVTNLMRLAFGH